jgi:coenzyme F420-reducing hydrogenase gamma subunit
MNKAGSRSPQQGAHGRPRLGVFKMASCDGCQLTLLNCEDELLAVAGEVDIVHFTEASSNVQPGGPFDVVLVEGSISSPEQIEQIHRIRQTTRKLITIGACASAGGIQALRNWADSKRFLRVVYAEPEYIETLATSTPIEQHVPVDFELRGCPIDKYQLIEVLTALLVGRRPQIPNESVCMECKREGNICVMVAHGEPCLGPVTHAGCGALCPSYDRGCYGCFGPRERANTASLSSWFRGGGMSREEVLRRFRGFTGWKEAFRKESERHE